MVIHLFLALAIPMACEVCFIQRTVTYVIVCLSEFIFDPGLCIYTRCTLASMLITLHIRETTSRDGF